MWNIRMRIKWGTSLKFQSEIFGCGEKERQSSEILFATAPIDRRAKCIGYKTLHSVYTLDKFFFWREGVYHTADKLLGQCNMLWGQECAKKNVTPPMAVLSLSFPSPPKALLLPRGFSRSQYTIHRGKNVNFQVTWIGKTFSLLRLHRYPKMIIWLGSTWFFYLQGPPGLVTDTGLD